MHYMIYFREKLPYYYITINFKTSKRFMTRNVYFLIKLIKMIFNIINYISFIFIIIQI